MRSISRLAPSTATERPGQAHPLREATPKNRTLPSAGRGPGREQLRAPSPLPNFPGRVGRTQGATRGPGPAQVDRSGFREAERPGAHLGVLYSGESCPRIGGVRWSLCPGFGARATRTERQKRQRGARAGRARSWGLLVRPAGPVSRMRCHTP